MAGVLRPQVILLDIAMPGMNGIETLKRLRKEAPQAAVIMISGHADHDQALQALDLGATISSRSRSTFVTSSAPCSPKS